MHPIFKSANGISGFLLALLPLWLIFAYLFLSTGRVDAVQSIVASAPVAAALGLFCLFPYYPCRAVPLGSKPVWKIALIHSILAMFFCGAVLATTHGAFLLIGHFIPDVSTSFNGLKPVIAAISCITYMLSTALHYVFESFERSRKAEVLSREAQLKALKAQVNPHFLFNSLNSISALTSIDSRRAREMCIRLSDFLRSSLKLGERSFIRFSEELALAETYLGVEQIRFGERLRVVHDIDPLCAHCEVPPLVIQPLVENAVKHGVATLVSGGIISISAHFSAGSVRIVVENNFDPDAPSEEKSGFGIANVRNRLRTNYGAAASLEVAVVENTYRVAVSLPCKQSSGKDRA